MLKKIFVILILLVIISFTGYVLVKAYPDFKAPALSSNEQANVTLEFWGPWDNSDAWQPIINDFQNKFNYIGDRKLNLTINYTKKDFLEYEKNLLEAQSAATAPDVFMINNNWLQRFAPDLIPLEQNKAYIDEYKLATFENLLDSFPRETINNWVFGGEVFGIPTYSDSLALYYNRDLFEKAGIKNPPKTWNEFKLDARKLTKIKNNEIVNSGAAFGTGRSVNRSQDIVAVLMMQGGAKVIDEQKNVDINKEIDVLTTAGVEKRDPGIRGIVFYSEFSDPQKEIYSWNDNLGNSVRAFADQKAAMMFGYSYQIENLLALSPDLNYEIATMPQLENSTPINIANVWTPVVSGKAKCKITPIELSDKIDCRKLAWSFLSFATQKENSKKYLDIAEKPAARKDLIGEQINANIKLGVFASQAESAISYNKFDDKIDAILASMLDEINSNRSGLIEIIDKTVLEIEGLKK